MGAFSDKVYETVRRIPAGYVLSYGDVARRIGEPRKSRFVGFALRNNPEPWTGEEGIPCHRVIFQDGRLADNFVFGGAGVQRAMLESEGVTFTEEGLVRMDRHRWRGQDPTDDFPTAPPIELDWRAELDESSQHERRAAGGELAVDDRDDDDRQTDDGDDQTD